MTHGNPRFVYRQISRCETEYKHPLFDDLVKECSGFYITPVEAQDTKGYPMTFEPKCSSLQCCWGLLKDTDKVVKLWFIIDSSD